MTAAALRDYIEEMELKIRYMKNDIEFKKSQISSRSIPKHMDNSNSVVQKSLCKSSVPLRTFPQSTSSRFEMNKESAREMTEKVSGNIALCNPKNLGLLRKASNEFSVSRTLQSTPPNPTQSSSSVLHATNIPQTDVSLFGNFVKSHQSAPGQTQRIVCLPSSSRTVIPPLSRTNNRTEQAQSVFCSYPRASLMSQERSSKNCSVIVPSKNLSVLPGVSNAADSQKVVDAVFSHSHRDILPRPTEQSHGSQATKSVYHPSMTKSRYKLVKSSVPNAPASISWGKVSCTNYLTSLSSCSSQIVPVRTVVTTSTPNTTFSGKLKSVPCRSNQGKSAKLNVQTAAKVVSKYKLKRLSPTSALKTPPSLFSENPEFSKRCSKCSKEIESARQLNSLHRLDRRPHCSSTPKDALKESKPQTSSHTSLHINHNKSKLQSGSHYCQQNGKNKLRLDKRFKLTEPKQKQHTRTGRKPSPLNQLSPAVSSFKWRKPVPIFNRSLTGSLQAHSSRFKWSRSKLQTQCGEWQQLRQRLKFLLSRKRRNLRWIVQKKVCSSTATSKRRITTLAGTDKTDLIITNGIMYKASSGRLLRTKAAGVCGTGMSKACFDSKSPSAKKNVLSEKMKLISVRGSHFHIDHTGKKLSRTGMCGQSSAKCVLYERSIYTNMDILQQSLDENARIAASRVVNRSIAIATAKQRRQKLSTDKRKQHCIFFGRFGKCHRGNKCPFIHDPEKIAVCTRFLRGKCDVAACPFSHKASIQKMPVCLFYLRGSCSREKCPYLHVKVNPNAPVCKDFRSGFCSLGEKCKNIHSYVCPSFAMTAVCSRGSLCTMLHRIRKKEPTFASLETKVEQFPGHKSNQESQTKKSLPTTASSSTIVVSNSNKHGGAEPSFISLSSSSQMEKSTEAKLQGKFESVYKITPVFLSIDVSNTSRETDSLGMRQLQLDDKVRISPVYSSLSSVVQDKSSGTNSQQMSLSHNSINTNMPETKATTEVFINKNKVEDFYDFEHEVSEVKEARVFVVLTEDGSKIRCSNTSENKFKRLNTMPFSTTVMNEQERGKDLECRVTDKAPDFAPIYDSFHPNSNNTSKTVKCAKDQQAAGSTKIHPIDVKDNTAARAPDQTKGCPSSCHLLEPENLDERLLLTFGDKREPSNLNYGAKLNETEASLLRLAKAECDTIERDCVSPPKTSHTLVTLSKKTTTWEGVKSNSTESQSCLSTCTGHIHSVQFYDSCDYIGLGGSVTETETDCPDTSVLEVNPEEEAKAAPEIIPLFITHRR